MPSAPDTTTASASRPTNGRASAGGPVSGRARVADAYPAGDTPSPTRPPSRDPGAVGTTRPAADRTPPPEAARRAGVEPPDAEACAICGRDPVPGWNSLTDPLPLCRTPPDSEPDQLSCRDLWHELAHRPPHSVRGA